MTDNKRFRVLRDATILAVVLLVMTVVWVMAADPPNTISYQGYLTDASGNAIDGSPDMQVVLYTVSTGGTGVYTETHSTVTVSDGQFNLQLGTGTTSGDWSNDVDFNQALWLEITVAGETLTPRIPLSTVPHARYAFTIADDAVTATKLSGISDNGTSGQVVTSNGFGGFSWADDATGADVTAVETISNNWVNTDYPWANNEVADALTIDGGTVDSSMIGGSSPAAGTFTALTADTSLTLPQGTGAGSGTEGQIYWDTDDDKLYVGDGTDPKEIGGGGGGGTITRYTATAAASSAYIACASGAPIGGGCEVVAGANYIDANCPGTDASTCNSASPTGWRCTSWGATSLAVYVICFQ